MLAGAGCLLQDRHVLVAEPLNPVSNPVAGLVVLCHAHRAATLRPGDPAPAGDGAREG